MRAPAQWATQRSSGWAPDMTSCTSPAFGTEKAAERSELRAVARMYGSAAAGFTGSKVRLVKQWQAVAGSTAPRTGGGAPRSRTRAKEARTGVRTVSVPGVVVLT